MATEEWDIFRAVEICFNLVIEMLLMATNSFIWSTPFCAICFNLVIEMLLMATPIVSISIRPGT